MEIFGCRLLQRGDCHRSPLHQLILARFAVPHSGLGSSVVIVKILVHCQPCKNGSKLVHCERVIVCGTMRTRSTYAMTMIAVLVFFEAVCGQLNNAHTLILNLLADRPGTLLIVQTFKKNKVTSGTLEFRRWRPSFVTTVGGIQGVKTSL